MKAALIYGKHDLRLSEVPVPTIGEDEVLVKVLACGVCATDVKKYSGEAQLAKVPLITGHEFTGEIVEVGKRAKSLINIGEKIVAAPVITCGKCVFCKSGMTFSHGVALCQNYKVIGHSIDGAFAEYVRVPAKNVYVLPNGASMVSSTIIEPVADCLHGVEMANVDLGKNVLVVGAGFMGLVTLQLCKMKGAEVYITDLIKERLEASLKLGADQVFDASHESIEEIGKRLKELTHGIGVDSIIFAIGGKKVIQSYIHFVKKGGDIVLLGSTFPPTKIEIDPNFLHYNIISLKGSVSYSIPDFVKSIDLVAKNHINSKVLITEVLGLEEIEKAFKMMEARSGLRKVIKFTK